MSKVQTEVSSTLFWHPFQASCDKEPLFVQYTRYQAQSASQSDVSFYLESPANGVLLDNEVWLHYYLTINDNVASGSPHANIPSITGQIRAAWATDRSADIFHKTWMVEPDYYTSLRCGLPLQRSTQNCAIDLNGTVMTYELSKYHDPMNRLYISQEEAPTVFSSSSGRGFDNGNHLGCFKWYAPGSGGNSCGTRIRNDGTETQSLLVGYQSLDSGAMQPDTYADNVSTWVPDDGQYYNEAFYYGGAHLRNKWRFARNQAYDTGIANNNAVTGSSLERYQQTVQIEIFEKLCFSPFHFFDNRDIKMSIPNIRTMQLTFQVHSNFPNLMFRCAGIATAFDVDFYSFAKPELLMRWFTPPPGYAIPKQISIPITKVWTYTNATLAPAAIYPAGLGTVGDVNRQGFIQQSVISVASGFSVSNISLPAMPDLFLLYFKRKLSEYTKLMPDDYNLSIARLQIDMEGNSGKLNNANKIHLWNMYRRHLRLYPVGRDSFDHWYRYHCIVPFTPSDLGVIKGAGFDNPIQISLSNIDLEYHYSFPSVGLQTNISRVNAPSFVCPSFNPEFSGIDAAGHTLAYSAGFDMHLICIYDKYALTLTSDGSSELQLLRVNVGGTSTAPPMVGPNALADIAI